MPSTEKTIYFFGSMLMTAVAIGVLGFGMSAEWAQTTVRCAREGSELFNGSAKITWRLFEGFMERVSCPGFESDLEFEVVPTLSKSSQTAPVALQVVVLFLLALCLLFSAITILVSLYNSVSNPYETYLGPVGVYVYSSVSACLAVLVLIIFAVNINVTSMTEEVVRVSASNTVQLQEKTVKMMLGYYMVVPYALLSLFTIAVIYMYHHAAYTQKKEQQRPTEDAPKEIMMY